MRSSLAALFLPLAIACSDPGIPDGGRRDFGIRDAEPREAGMVDARPDADVTLDAGSRDVGPTDGPGFDGGSGVSCEQPLAWPALEVPLVDTTTEALHRTRFECAGLGGGATAPERWIESRFDRPAHAIIRLGTGGWDAVMSVRTATCAPSAEAACADAPTIVELPSIVGSLFIGVDGFTDGGGPFVLSGESGPPLEMPPENAECATASVASLPVARSGHNFGADRTVAIEDCALVAPVFVPVELGSGGALSVRAEPRAGGDLSIAVLSECGETLSCSAFGGAGRAETISQLALGAGRATIVVGSPPGASSGSFSISAAIGAECVSDSDCPIGQSCGRNLACGALAPSSAASSAVEIPDNDRVEVPLFLSGPTSRPKAVRLRLAIEHEFPRDLVVTLSAPGGWPKVRLRDRLDGARDSVYGKDRPADGPGTMFDFGLAATASGTWTLEVLDRAPGDVGRVTGAVLEVE